MNNKNTTLWTRDFISLFMNGFFMFFGFQFLLPTLPLYAIERLNASSSHIGYLISAYALAALLARPYAGYTYDSLGKKKTFIISMTLFTLITFIYPLAGSFLLFMLFRFMHGLVFGVATTGASTIVADIVPAARRSEGMGYFGLANTLSMAMGPAVGLWILAHYDYPPLFVSSGLVISIALIIAIFFRYPHETPVKRKLTWNSVFEKRIISVALLVMGTSSMFAGVVGFITVYSKEINVGNVGFFFVINSLGVVLTRLFAGRVQDKSGPKPVIVFGYIVMAFGFVALSISKNITMLYLSSLLIGLGNGSVMPALQAMVIDMVEAKRRGVATSTYFAALDVGIAGGSILLGWIAELTSLSTMFFICAIYLVVPLLLFIFYTLHDYNKKVAEIEPVIEEIVFN